MKRAGMMWKIKKTNLLYPRSRIFMTKTRHSVQGIVPSRIQVYSWTLKDRACIKWQKFYQVLRAKLPQHSHFTIVSEQTLLAQKKSDHLGKQEIKLLVISLIYSRIFFKKNWLLLSLWTIANHEIFVILHLVLTLWLARLCQLRQSETIRACACAVLDDQRMRELCWFGQRCQLLSHINAREGLLGWEGDPSTRGRFSSYKWSLSFPWGGRSIACCDEEGLTNSYDF